MISNYKINIASPDNSTCIFSKIEIDYVINFSFDCRASISASCCSKIISFFTSVKKLKSTEVRTYVCIWNDKFIPRERKDFFLSHTTSVLCQTEIEKRTQQGTALLLAQCKSRYSLHCRVDCRTYVCRRDKDGGCKRNYDDVLVELTRRKYDS